MDSSYPKCESISSSEKDIEYLRVIYPFQACSSIKTTNSFTNQLSVQLNEIVKLVEDDVEGLDYDKSWLKVFNSEGVTGMIPSKCVEPLLEHQLQDFVFIRRPALNGALAYNKWYFGNITRFDAILLLNKYAANGDYLVRDSDVSFFVFLFYFIMCMSYLKISQLFLYPKAFFKIKKEQNIKLRLFKIN